MNYDHALDFIDAFSVEQANVYETAQSKGWYDNGSPNEGERIALMHSELSEALEAIRNLKPDVVSLDIRMPKMSGIEVLRAIKRDRLTCTPIVLSGLTDEFSREKYLELGARYVFDKGTELEKFLQVLGRSRKIRRKFPARARPCARKRAGSAAKLRRKPMDKGRQMI